MSLYDVTEELKQSLRESRNTITSCGGRISATAGFKDLPKAIRTVPRGTEFLRSMLDGGIVGVTVQDLYGATCLRKFAFAYCSFLTEVEIPSTVRYINDYAFRDCSSLLYVTLKDGLEWIGISAFAYCTRLPSIKIPKTVTYIYSKAFNACINCLEYDFTSFDTPPNLPYADAFAGMNKNAQIKVKASALPYWKEATNWSVYADYMVGV